MLALVEMPRTPKNSTIVPHVGYKNNGGAKRGRKVQANNDINDLVVTHYEGDRKAAALAWGVSEGTVNKVISQGFLSARLAIRIAEVLKDKVDLEKLVALTKPPASI